MNISGTAAEFSASVFDTATAASGGAQVSSEPGGDY